MKNKKILIVACIALVVILTVGAMVAYLTDTDTKVNNITIGSVDVDIENLAMKNKDAETVRVIAPGDINTINWTGSNKGTSAVLTRYNVEIYWPNATSAEDVNLLSLYPASTTDEKIRQDFEELAQDTEKITTTAVTKEVNNKTVYGMKYQFVGETLEGSDNKGIATETSQNISFKIALSPKTSYLLQDAPISVNVEVEGMQYTEEGAGTWTVLDSNSI